MRIRSIELTNIGIFESAKAEFARDAAVIVGKNNSGKTSLLKAASLQWQPAAPRLSSVLRLTRPNREAFVQSITLELEIDAIDIETSARQLGTAPVPMVPGVDSTSLWQAVEQGRVRLLRQERWKGMGSHTISVRQAGRPDEQKVMVFEWHNSSLLARGIRNPDSGAMERLVGGLAVDLFRFDADRSRASEKVVRPMPRIDPRGDELVTAFNHLHAEQQLQFLSIVQRVLPEIARLKSEPTQEGRVQLRMWFGSDYDERLGFNLAEVGYGTANVLALLFAATMDPGRRIILIDEPATYLHPGAVRELMAVLAEHPRHQYIFATHSFSGLERFPLASFSLCNRAVGSEVATIANCPPNDASTTRRLLADVGASLTDVFAAEKIIWVEGPSDVEALKEAMKALPTPPPRGLTLLPLIDTGSLEGKLGDLVAEVYRSLSTSAALIPPSIHFALDPEKRPEAALADLRKRLSTVKTGDAPAPGLSVYPAKMLENLFLDPAVVADALNEMARTARASPLVPCDAAAIDALWNAAKPDTEADRTAEPDRWCKEVHGAKVLDLTFAHFYGPTLTYRKKHHAATFARAALRHNSPGGRQLRDFAASLLQPAGKT